MVWTEEVHSNRKAVQRKPPQSGTQPRKPNAKLISLVAATGAVALTVWWRREGRKLNGRQLRIPFLDGLQNWFRSIGNESGKTARQPQQQQQWKGQRPENMAGAAALARATGQQPQPNKQGGGGGGNKKKGGGKKGGKKKKK